MVNGIRTGDLVGSIKDIVRSSVKVPEFDKHLKKAGGYIGRNVVEITIKMKIIVRKPFMIKPQKFNGEYWKDLLLLAVLIVDVICVSKKRYELSYTLIQVTYSIRDVILLLEVGIEINLG